MKGCGFNLQIGQGALQESSQLSPVDKPSQFPLNRLPRTGTSVQGFGWQLGNVPERKLLENEKPAASKHFRQFQKTVPLTFPGYQKTCRCIGTECQRSPRSIRWRKSLHKFHRSAFDGNCEYTWASIQSLS